jgi:hypothetical protein
VAGNLPAATGQTPGVEVAIMEREKLKGLIHGYWRFAREFVRQQGDWDKTLEAVGRDWNAEGEEIAQGLHSAGIDPAGFWDFHSLIWHDWVALDPDVPIPEARLRELRLAMHRAYLPIMLFDATAPPPLDPIQEDIIEVITLADCRMTITEVQSALLRARFNWHDQKVRTTLVAMNRAGLLNNSQKGINKGYGLPHWTVQT